MKKTSLILTLIVIGVGLLQFIRPEEPEIKPIKQTNDMVGVPKEVNQIIRNSCFDCHSSGTNLHWYDKLTPVNFIIYDHIKNGRKAMDFSKWDSLPMPAQNNMLYYSLNKILEGEMPLAAYTAIHPKKKLSDADIRTFEDFLAKRTPRKSVDSAQVNEVNRQFSDFIKGKMTLSGQQVKPAPNGIQYIPGYRNWKAISITDRFDNGTMRIIYGNEVAVKAIQQFKTNPWPNGTVFAKAAWKEQTNADGSISTGQFFQVEFMIKDAQKYKSTKGWGWARWRGNDLKPYGENPTFTMECVSCHQPMKNNDYVFTQPLYLKNYLQKIYKK